MKERLSFRKIKRFLSFGRMLRNDKLMVIVSLCLAAVAWYNIISGPANITERSIAVDVTVDLSESSAAYQDGLRIMGENEFSVKVNVSGPWATLVKMDETDIRVESDWENASDGINAVQLEVFRNSELSGYDILSVTPSRVEIACEYWREGAIFEVKTKAGDDLTVADPNTMVVGKMFLDKTAFPTGCVTLDGPKDVIDSISTIVAEVSSDQPLTKQQVFKVPLVAYDEMGRVVDMERCTIRELSDGIVSVTVPVWERRTINVKYTLTNLPTYITDVEAFKSECLQVSPSQMVVCASEHELDLLEAQLDLGEIDFAELLRDESNKKTFPLTINPNVTLEKGSSSVTITLSKPQSLAVVPTEDTIRFVDKHGNDITATVFEDYAVDVSDSQTPLELLVFGDAAEFSAEDLVWTVTLDEDVNVSARVYHATVLPKDSSQTVWIVEKELNDSLVLDYEMTMKLTPNTSYILDEDDDVIIIPL